MVRILGIAICFINFYALPVFAARCGESLKWSSERVELRALNASNFLELKWLKEDKRVIDMSGDPFDPTWTYDILNHGQPNYDVFSEGVFLNLGIYFRNAFIGACIIAVEPTGNVVRAGIGQLGEIWVQVAYHLHPDFWRQGIATEVVGTMVKNIFLSPEVAGVTAYTLAENEGSQRVLKKNGFKQHGVFSFSPGPEGDRTLFAITRSF